MFKKIIQIVKSWFIVTDKEMREIEYKEYLEERRKFYKRISKL